MLVRKPLVDPLAEAHRVGRRGPTIAGFAVGFVGVWLLFAATLLIAGCSTAESVVQIAATL